MLFKLPATLAREVPLPLPIHPERKSNKKNVINSEKQPDV